MSKKITLFIQQNATNAVYNAYQFATQALENGYELAYVFFWRESVSIANQNITLAGDDINLQKLWQDLSQQYTLPLYLCKSSAWRRGINQDNLAQHFILSSLGRLSENLTPEHKLISF